jgi:hypothetical protein
MEEHRKRKESRDNEEGRLDRDQDNQTPIPETAMRSSPSLLTAIRFKVR